MTYNFTIAFFLNMSFDQHKYLRVIHKDKKLSNSMEDSRKKIQIYILDKKPFNF